MTSPRALEAPAMTHHVFGPVPSRRLGRSLGIDLVPFKTCSYDCIYCQLGRTTCKTTRRKAWTPPRPLLEELEEKLESRPDYVTLSGSGEPTLFQPLDKLIEGIRALTDTPLAVLTNGSLLGDSELQRELAGADLVIPSLDAGNENMFQLVNRPAPGLSFERMLSGLIAFRRGFRGQLWLEVFLLGNYTTFEQELTDIRRCVDRIQPDRVQLNTVTRPAAERYAATVSPERLAEIAREFTPPAEVIAEFRARREDAMRPSGQAEVLELLRRRPCTVEDVVAGLGMHRQEVLKCVEHLAGDGLVVSERGANADYWKASTDALDGWPPSRRPSDERDDAE